MIKSTSRSTGKLFVFTAFVAFAIGYRANPFHMEQKPDLVRIHDQYQAAVNYDYNGVYEGAVNPMHEESRQPASIANSQPKSDSARAYTQNELRASFAQAKIAFKKGKCQEVQENLQPVGRYLKNFDYSKIVEDCKNKFSNNAKTEQSSQE